MKCPAADAGGVRSLFLLLALLALPAQAKKLSYHGGRLMTAPRWVMVPWGSYWQTQQGEADLQRLDQFAAYLAQSPDYLSAMQEYAVPGHPIGAGVYEGAFPQLDDPPALVYETGIGNFVDRVILAGAVPPRTADRIYMVMLPPGVVYQHGPGLPAPGGYHLVNPLSATGGPVHYLEVTYKGLDRITEILSHEMAETITDPDAGDLKPGWYDDLWDQPADDGPFKGEIGDLCSFGTWLDGWWVAALWSNVQNACVTSGLSASGGCPAGTVDQGGFCVPSAPPIGCNTPGSSAGALLALGLIAGRARRRGAKPTRPKLPAAEAAQVQAAHIAHLREMARAGKMFVAGPFDDQPDPALRGM